MTLRTRLAAHVVLLLIAMFALSGSAWWGLNGLRQDFGTALAGYQSLRNLYEIGWHVSAARLLTSLNPPQDARALWEIRQAIQSLPPPPPTAVPRLDDDPLRLELTRAAEELQWRSSNLPRTLELVINRLRDRALEIRNTIEAAERDAEIRRQGTTFTLASVALVMLLGALAIGAAQYRAIVAPLDSLARSVRIIASGRFSERAEKTGDLEFVELANDFNRMADELNTLYRSLEQQVQAKTQMLIRSERLAGVGAIAAGVAHEINNPLGIIAGFAQVQLQQIERSGRSDPALADSLKVICDEAFRAKRIIERLLSLSRVGEEGRRYIDPAVLALELVRSVNALPAAKDRQIEFIDESDGEDDAQILADEGEIKQVLLNLVVNALQAVEPHTGQVKVSVGRSGQRVRIVVSDNGRGMAPAVLEKLFEPFFSARPADPETGERGVGLGLSITHAIVQAHGGTIEAFSDGPGTGSRFVVQLPVATDASEEKD
jgi:signal transduction histidine kinase